MSSPRVLATPELSSPVRRHVLRMRKVRVCGITPPMTKHGARLGLVLILARLVAACGTASPEAGVPHDAKHDAGIDVAVPGDAGTDAPSRYGSPDAATTDV